MPGDLGKHRMHVSSYRELSAVKLCQDYLWRGLLLCCGGGFGTARQVGQQIVSRFCRTNLITPIIPELALKQN